MCGVLRPLQKSDIEIYCFKLNFAEKWKALSSHKTGKWEEKKFAWMEAERSKQAQQTRKISEYVI